MNEAIVDLRMNSVLIPKTQTPNGRRSVDNLKELSQVIWKWIKRIWNYLKEQNEIAIQHHKAIQARRDEFYAKHYWHIRHW